MLLITPGRTGRLVAGEAAAAAACILAVGGRALGGTPWLAHDRRRRRPSPSSASTRSTFSRAGRPRRAHVAKGSVLPLEEPRHAEAAVGAAVVWAVR